MTQQIKSQKAKGKHARQTAVSLGARAQSAPLRTADHGLRTDQGFSLVETLVAIAVLLIAILAPMRITTESIKASSFSREQLTAVFLAQESTEALIRLRDDPAIEAAHSGGGDTWDWIPGACTGASGCDYDAASESFISCSGDNCRIYFNDAPSAGEGYYSHDGNDEATPFTRTLTVEEASGQNELEVTTTVTWESAALNDTVNLSVQTTILDGYE